MAVMGQTNLLVPPNRINPRTVRFHWPKSSARRRPDPAIAIYSALTALSEEYLELVIAHAVAHIQRSGAFVDK
jgi:Zn-dependent protease with chaperone function